ncbi:MAG: DUF4145 domain-containing protein [Alphaproteobacteria bacterium]|nr:DUF4145 domain-containing protein [Alphaproteobacteria bacterium]
MSHPILGVTPNKTWACPSCRQKQVLQSENHDLRSVYAETYPESFEDSKFTHVRAELFSQRIDCINEECKQGAYYDGVIMYMTNYRPASSTKLLGLSDLRCLNYPIQLKAFKADDIPAHIMEDYKESKLIVQNSPKSAAVLIRRAMHSVMIDFYGAKGDHLKGDIDALEKDESIHIDSTIIDVFRGLKDKGNIGAHLKTKGDDILEISLEDASLMIDMFELIVEYTYDQRFDKKKRLNAFLGEALEEEKKSA